MGRRYDRDLTDIFAIQDEISKAIVAALRVKLCPREKAIETRGTSNVEAYNLYLMARQQWITGDYSDARRPESIVRICSKRWRSIPTSSGLALMARLRRSFDWSTARRLMRSPLPNAHCRSIRIPRPIASKRVVRGARRAGGGEPAIEVLCVSILSLEVNGRPRG